MITKYTATATWMIPDETKAKLMEYIQTHKEELKCDRYHEQLEKAYEAIITDKVEFQRIGNALMQATIPFFVKPYKKNRYGDDTITITTSGTIRNLGNVASKPIVTVTGGTSVEIAGVEMTFGGSGSLVVDCENHIVTQNSEIFTGSVTGDFWTIPKGECEVTGSCVIQPRWRWR